MTAQPFSLPSAPADLLSHPFSQPNAPFMLSPRNEPYSAFAPSEIPSPHIIGKVCDLVALFALLFMLYRTANYIRARTAGAAGPAPATTLLKFWSVAGALHFFFHIFHLYLQPMHVSWFSHILRAVIFVPLCLGRRLTIATLAFDVLLTPFFDERAEDIEKALTDISTQAAAANDALAQLARAILERLAVGGVPAVLAMPAELFSAFTDQQRRQQQQQSQYQTEQREQTNPNQTINTQNDSNSTSSTAGRPNALLLPQPPLDNPRATTRFRAGGSDVRADVARRAALPPAVERVVDGTIEDMPRPAFDTSRALRARFRERFQRRAAKAALR